MEIMSVVLAVSEVCAVLAGIVHVYIFILESVIWTSPRVRRIFGVESDAAAQATRGLAFNQGFYNLFLAIGAILGVILVLTGSGATGWTLVVFSCACMLGASVILAGTGRRYLNSAFVQGTFPFIALLFAFIASMFQTS
jgi:putative membrane protein